MRIESELTAWDDELDDDVELVVVIELSRFDGWELMSARHAGTDVEVDGRLLKAAESHAEELIASGECESFLDD